MDDSTRILSQKPGPYSQLGTMDSNPGPVFSIPGFGIGEFLIPGSRDPGGIMGSRRYDIKTVIIAYCGLILLNLCDSQAYASKQML